MESSSEAKTLRARLGHIIPPLLRLVTAILAGLPSSRQAREAAAAFVESHHRALLRILREAASPAVRCEHKYRLMLALSSCWFVHCSGEYLH